MAYEAAGMRYVARGAGGLVPVCEMPTWPVSNDLLEIADWLEAAAEAASRNEVLKVPDSFFDDCLKSARRSEAVVERVVVEERGQAELDGEAVGSVCAGPEPVRRVEASESGYCYIDMFVEESRVDAAITHKEWPTVAELVLSGAECELLSDEELDKVFVDIVGNKVHVNVVEGSVTALDMVNAVRASWRAGVVGMFDKLRVGGGSAESLTRAKRMYNLVKSPLCGTKFEESAARAHVGLDNCWQYTLSKLFGESVCVGRKTVEEVVRGEVFRRAAVAAGDPWVVVWHDPGSEKLHIAEAGDERGGIDGVYDVVRASCLLRVVTDRDKCCWVEDRLVRVFPPVPVGKVLCVECGCVVQADGHAERCRPVVVRLSGELKTRAWLGDALQTLDVRQALVDARVPPSSATVRSQLYLHGPAQAAWYRKWLQIVGREDDGANDTVMSDRFEAEYVSFRDMYLVWLRAELWTGGNFERCVSVGSSEGSVEVSRAVSVLGSSASVGRPGVTGKLDSAEIVSSEAAGSGGARVKKKKSVSFDLRPVVTMAEYRVEPEVDGRTSVYVCPVAGCSKASRGIRWLSIRQFEAHMSAVHKATMVTRVPAECNTARVVLEFEAAVK